MNSAVFTARQFRVLAHYPDMLSSRRNGPWGWAASVKGNQKAAQETLKRLFQHCVKLWPQWGAKCLPKVIWRERWHSVELCESVMFLLARNTLLEAVYFSPECLTLFSASYEDQEYRADRHR